MKIRFFGIGSATPHLERHPSACLVELGNESILIDCGEGTQYRLLENKVKHSRIGVICITHLHGDHFFGLVGLLSSWNLARRQQELIVYGPEGLEEIINVQLAAGNSKFSFPIKFVVINPVENSIIHVTDRYEIKAIPLTHRVPCTGFIVSTTNTKRKILAHKLPAEFPVVYFKKLQAGEDVQDELTGLSYLNSEFTTDGESSKTFAYCSDTAYKPDLIPHLQNVDILYHEATFGDELADRAEMTQHSTARQAASIAAQCNAKMLLLGHFSSRYKSLENLEQQAKEIFPNSFIINQGKIYDL